jgi:hypothetical protein
MAAPFGAAIRRPTAAQPDARDVSERSERTCQLSSVREAAT